MNERMLKLYKQAQVPHTAIDPSNNMPYATTTFSADKFAELIVAEMCQVMKAEGEQFSLDQNFDAVKGVGRCMRKVKQHFGVEE